MSVDGASISLEGIHIDKLNLYKHNIIFIHILVKRATDMVLFPGSRNVLFSGDCVTRNMSSLQPGCQDNIVWGRCLVQEY